MATPANTRKSSPVSPSRSAGNGHGRGSSKRRDAAGHVEQHPESSGIAGQSERLSYVVVFERAPRNFSAYVPDLPGCVATGKTRADVERLIREAIGLHLDMMREYNEPIPPPAAWAEVVET